MAFLGAILNFSFVFAGSAGVNPAMILVSGMLILAWRNAGWYGLDRFVLPKLGTPWHRGEVFDPAVGQGLPGDDHLTRPARTRRTPRHPPGVLPHGGPPGPETAGRSAGAAAGRMGEAQLGGMRLPPDRGGDNHDRDAVPFDQPRPPARDRR